MPKKFSIGLILLIIFFGPVQLAFTLKSMAEYPQGWGLYYSTCPKLWIAIVVREILLGTNALAWVYAAWVLLRRRPATLPLAQTSLVVGAVLRIVGMFSVGVLGGLPWDVAWEMIQVDIRASVGIGLFVAGCCMYLARSNTVRGIYAA